jgi:tetratricopeptide (TPR) repeat protein
LGDGDGQSLIQAEAARLFAMKKWRSVVYAAVAVLIVAVACAAGYYIISYFQGAKLAQQGYEASARADHDTAIAKYDAALHKPVSSYQRSYVYLNRGAANNFKWRFDEAIRDHTQALRLNPQLSEAYAGRGLAYLRKGENEKAIADLTEAIRLDPNSHSAYYNRGLIFLQKDEPDKAVADLEEAVRCNPRSAEALVMRGMCYIAKNDFDRALASFDGAIAVDPTNAIGYMERSNLYGRKGEYDKRDRDYAQALHLNPDIAKASSDFARLLTAQQWREWSREFSKRNAGKDYFELFREAQAAATIGNHERAIELYNDFLALDITAPQASVATMNRGNAFKAKGELDRALRDYNQAIGLDSQNAGAYVNRAGILAQQRKREAALADYAEAIRLNPKQWEAYFDRAATLAEAGELDRAIADLTEAINLNPKFVGTYVNRADVFMRRREFDKAIEDCNTAIQLEPNASGAFWVRANAYKFKGDRTKALGDLETAVRLKPRKLEIALNSVAWLRATAPEASIRDGKKAVELATKACELSVWRNPSFIDTLAAGYAEIGDFDQAFKYQKQALSISGLPDSAQAGAQKRLELYKQHKAYREE